VTASLSPSRKMFNGSHFSSAESSGAPYIKNQTLNLESFFVAPSGATASLSPSRKMFNGSHFSLAESSGAPYIKNQTLNLESFFVAPSGVTAIN